METYLLFFLSYVVSLIGCIFLPAITLFILREEQLDWENKIKIEFFIPIVNVMFFAGIFVVSIFLLIRKLFLLIEFLIKKIQEFFYNFLNKFK